METVKRISETEIEVDGLVYKREQPEKSEFRVGMWVIGKTSPIDGNRYLPYRPKRIESIDDYSCSWQTIDDEFKGDVSSGCLLHWLRPATHSEIEEHLKKICDKYIGKEVKCLALPHGKELVISKIFSISYVEYYDQYWMEGSNGDGVCVYQKGVFAEIPPSLKKKPETKEEFKEFLVDYIHSQLIADNYLKTYEI